MSYTVLISKRAEKDIDALKKQEYKRVRAVLERLCENPYVGKKLVGDLKGYYSIRVWPYRIVYEIKKQKLIVLVLRVGHRKEVYK